MTALIPGPRTATSSAATLKRHAIPAHWPLYGVVACFMVHLLAYGALSTLGFFASGLWAIASTLTALWCLWLRQWRRALLIAMPGVFLVLIVGWGYGLRTRIIDWGTELRFMVNERDYRAQAKASAGSRVWMLGHQDGTEYQVIFDPRGDLVAQTLTRYSGDGCQARVQRTHAPFYMAALSC